MHREKRRRKIIIASLLVALLLMATGYAVFGTNLDIKGSTKVTSNWEVLITHITPGTPTGNAENTDGISPECDISGSPKSCNGLSAELSADLYEAGDSMEYIVTIENRGNLDAKLEGIDKGTPTNTNAVIITYSGYAEGQKLLRNSSMDIKVKVEYNPEYTEGEVTGESNISFSFVQAESVDDITKVIDDEVISKPDRTITYNCQENGGEEANQNSIFDVGDRVDLGVQCHKEGYTFLGWNTNKDAHSGIGEDSSEHTTLNNTSNSTTIYGIYSKTIDVKYKNEMLDNMNNWGINYPNLFNVSYDENTNMNNVTVVTTGGYWEQIYIPIDTVVGSQYTVTFDYELENSYTPLSGHSGIGYQALRNVTNTNGLSNQLAMGYIPTTIGSDTINLTFTAATTKTYFTFNFGMAADRVTTSIKLGNIRVKKGNNNVTKRIDTCTIYNKTTSCDFDLPTVLLDNDVDNTYYDLEGWYINDVFIGNSGESHTYTNNATVNTVVTILPVMMSGPNFQIKIDSIKSSVTEIEFVDTDEATPPNTIDNLTSWDVSAKQNGSVIAWLDGTKMYIGGKGGIIGNSDCTDLFKNFDNTTSIEFNDNFDTSKVTIMRSMFYDCHNILDLDLSNFDTSNVTTMVGMFDDTDNTGTSNLRSITFGNKWNTSKVTNMNNMFCDCHSLQELDVSMFDTSNVTNMIGMFARCYELKKIEGLETFNTSKVTTMSYMFGSIFGITTLNLINFNTLNVQDMSYMFNYDTNLKAIYVSDKFVTTNVTNSSYMFNNDTNLVGGNGTAVADKLTTDATHAIDKTYAKIDKENQEGYFTDGSYPVIRSVNTTTTSNSITVVVDAWIPNGDSIKERVDRGIEFSIDGGAWQVQNNQEVADNIYTFTNLSYSTSHSIRVRVTSVNNKSVTKTLYDDTKVPTDDLLFWGDASNPNNTSTTLKNKVQAIDRPDGTIVNFNGTTSSGYNDGELVFDGVDDYVNIGPYTFNNTQSYVIYMKSNDASKNQEFFGNWESAGGGLSHSSAGTIGYTAYNKDKNTWISANGGKVNINNYYTIIGTYDGSNLKLYVDGVLVGTSDIFTNLKDASTFVSIGANPPTAGNPTNMNLREALLYDRALTEKEVKEITNNFEEKWNTVRTKRLSVPTFRESETENDKITITYPTVVVDSNTTLSCSNGLTCSYSLNGGNYQTVTQTTREITYTSAGTLIAKVSDGYNEVVTNTYNLTWDELYVASSALNGNDSTGYGTISAPYATMNKAYQSAKDEATIYVMDNITPSSTTNFNSNKDITLTSCTKNGNTCTYSSNNSVIRGSSFTEFVINETVGELTLENITLDGNKDNVTSLNSILSNGINSRVYIVDGAILKNNNTTNDRGGAIYNRGFLNINGGDIINNHGIYGGAILQHEGILTIEDGNISNNECDLSGGAIHAYGTININGGKINSNVSGTGGGAIRMPPSGGIINMTDGIISGNTATNEGGGISSNGTLNISGGTISDNTATNNAGGGIYEEGNLNVIGGMILNNATNNNGGGIYVNGNGTVTISQTTGKTTLIDNNEAINGGGIYVASGKSLTISGGEISGNTATNGGGIYAIGSGTIAISQVTGKTTLIDGNEANDGGGVYIGNGKSLTVSSGTISNNITTHSGGGIFATEIGTVTISGTSLIDGNRASSTGTGNGGGLLISHGKVLNMTGGTISNNYISNCGGGLFLGGPAEHTISGGLITGNEAGVNSGGILLSSVYDSAKLTMSGGEISDNHAADTIAGMYIHSGAIFEMNGGAIKDNVAKKANGGIYKDSNSTFTKNNGTVCGNTPSNQYDDSITCPT